MINSSTTKAIASNTAYQLIGKVITMSITILATVIITRFYGKQGYGEFSLMQNIPALFFIIVDFGLNAIATREISKDYEKAKNFIGNIIVMRVAMSFLLMAAAVFALSFFPYSSALRFGIYLSLFLILTQALIATTNIIFQVKLRYDYSTIGLVLGSIFILFFVLLFSWFELSIVWVNFSYVIGGLVTFCINLWLIKRYIGLNINLRVDKTVWRYLIMQSFPIGLMFIFSQINFKSDSIMLSVMDLPTDMNLTNTEAVGVYGLGYKIFEVALVVPTFFMNAAYPVLVRHMQIGAHKLKNTFFRSITSLIFIGIAASIIGIVFAEFAVGVLGGPEFSQSAVSLRLLLIGLPVFYASQPVSWLIVTLDSQKYLPYAYLAGSVFNLAANYMYIPKYSFYASSTITWLSEIIILSLLALFALKAWRKKYA
jgi:O-antigen/teichoic acid export membrane protein